MKIYENLAPVEIRDAHKPEVVILMVWLSFGCQVSMRFELQRHYLVLEMKFVNLCFSSEFFFFFYKL